MWKVSSGSTSSRAALDNKPTVSGTAGIKPGLGQKNLFISLSLGTKLEFLMHRNLGTYYCFLYQAITIAITIIIVIIIIIIII